MRISLLVAFSSILLSLSGQTKWTHLNSTIPNECGIDSVSIQLLQTVGEPINTAIPGEVKLVRPTDLVMFLFKKKDGVPIIVNPTYVEGDTIQFKLKQSDDCNEVVVNSSFESRLREYEAFIQDTSRHTPDFILETIKKNSHSIFVNQYLSFYAEMWSNDHITSSKIIDLFKEAPLQIQESSLIKPILSRIELFYKKDKFSIFDYPLIEHPNNASFERPAPKYYFYTFWYTRCAPCIKAHQIMTNDLEQQKFPANTELISICSDVSSVEDWTHYLNKKNLPWKHYHLGKNSKEIINKYGVNFYPTYILTDAKGNILKYTGEYTELLYKLESLNQ